MDIMNDTDLRNVKRLLGAIIRHTDESNLVVLSKILVYHKGQLAEDIESLEVLLSKL